MKYKLGRMVLSGILAQSLIGVGNSGAYESPETLSQRNYTLPRTFNSLYIRPRCFYFFKDGGINYGLNIPCNSLTRKKLEESEIIENMRIKPLNKSAPICRRRSKCKI